MNQRQMKFAQLYPESGNATQSYMKAGYAAKGKVAEVNGSKLLRNAKVELYLKELQSESREKHKVTIDRLIHENSKLAFQDLNEVAYVENGELKLKEKIDLNQLDGVSISCSESESERGFSRSHSFSIKLSAKIKALQELARLTGAYEQKPEDNLRNREVSADVILGSLRKFLCN